MFDRPIALYRAHGWKAVAAMASAAAITATFLMVQGCGKEVAPASQRNSQN